MGKSHKLLTGSSRDVQFLSKHGAQQAHVLQPVRVTAKYSGTQFERLDYGDTQQAYLRRRHPSLFATFVLRGIKPSCHAKPELLRRIIRTLLGVPFPLRTRNLQKRLSAFFRTLFKLKINAADRTGFIDQARTVAKVTAEYGIYAHQTPIPMAAVFGEFAY